MVLIELGRRWGLTWYHCSMSGQAVTPLARAEALEQDLPDIVRRIVDAVDPDRIVLFGSAARREMGPNSDLDLLLIKRGTFSHSLVTRDVYRSLRDIPYAKDIIVITPEEAEQYRDCFAVVICPARRDGRVIYERPSE